ncbi:hypothetical protein J2Z69_000156 [Paenibacillus shirakamiensis]|uniref:Uncharacterized protein n=1 Tax=Paenibacillus shirakamiensis TaxID=1265935 RepID=A0ABS4JBP8_9BACL|nr:hypothetical protein [Paenibacillus shirakamiensis]MBP1999137.1 hypothetical protein [Paenibacillus shirakamiensis]
MKKTMKKTIIYGVLMVAGTSLGFQLANNTQTNVALASVPNAIDGRQQVVVQQQSGKFISGGAQQSNSGQILYEVQGNQLVQAGQIVQWAPVSSSQSNIEVNPSVQSTTATSQPLPKLQTPGTLLLPEANQPAVDRLADRTGELLQNASQKSMKWVVSLFSSLTD